MQIQLKNYLGYIQESKGMSQEQLGWKSHVSRHTISEMELNKRVPSVRTALLLAKALECSVEDIFKIEEK